MHGFARSGRLLTAYLGVGMLVVALLTAGGCGPSEATGSVATTSTGNGSSSGPGDGAGGSAAGSPPAGTTGTDSGGSTGPASSGSGSGTANDAGASGGSGGATGGAASGSTGSGGSSDASGNQGSSGGSTSPSVPADPCAGLVPASLGSPVDVALATVSACGPSSSDPSGRMTLGTWADGGAAMWPYSASGLVQGDVMTTLVVTGEDLDRWFHWTSSGYRGIVQGTSGFFPFQIATWDTAGHVVARSSTGVIAITPDGHGGSVAIVTDQSASSTVPLPPKLLQWIDAAGRVTRSVSLDQDAGAVVVNWTTGHLFALVFGQSSRPTQGRWYDASGNPLTAWFSLNVSKGSGSAWHLLVDGTLVLTGPSHEWAVATTDGVEGPVPVPEWLKARPNTRLSTIRSGRAYAVVTLGIADRFEVVTASGTSCGTVTLPSAAPQVGIYSPRLDIGQDGTVIHSVGPAPAADGGSSSCRFQWWAGLLK